MIYKHNIYEFKRYLVYKKEQGKIVGKSIKNTERKYDEISQIIKKICYLWILLSCQIQEVKFNIDRIIPKPRGMNLASIFQLSKFIG